jgi:hypothetical protein
VVLSVTLFLVSSDTQTTGYCTHESADKAAKEALPEKPAPEIRATKNDWFKTAKKKERNEW